MALRAGALNAFDDCVRADSSFAVKPVFVARLQALERVTVALLTVFAVEMMEEDEGCAVGRAFLASNQIREALRPIGFPELFRRTFGRDRASRNPFASMPR